MRPPSLAGGVALSGRRRRDRGRKRSPPGNPAPLEPALSAIIAWSHRWIPLPDDPGTTTHSAD
ncbi:hypothetical protein SCOCK_40059 [Actinacidiphila cocklensis]|uniref:Uncharacterized protein n=1 Tax=Actinacidiphila cocklensis TaxID=887465 RepID=A0A9W4DYE3_9ACTN|nr:hypothetical protein SCOCK_40059 [Actinacidiphila cocklensis]